MSVPPGRRLKSNVDQSAGGTRQLFSTVVLFAHKNNDNDNNSVAPRCHQGSKHERKSVGGKGRRNI
jgi:hypothetical protein